MPHPLVTHRTAGSGALLSAGKASFVNRPADSRPVTSIGVDRSETPTVDATRYSTFTLRGDAYALDIFHITEILERRPLTTVPMNPV